ncbi:MAG: CDP-alcohol phosphatidyltransferase family protein [Ignavibacteriae bacterium]|nr:MAG: CDP-alcohol phosphatidyltransferase family protein [Ignavibacteriota bacterium]
MSTSKNYSYHNTLKSDKSDELINTYLLRPVAGIIVRVLFHTPVTPNQVTLLSIISGIAAAVFYGIGTSGAFVAAGLLVTLKDILDSADGQLARAREQQSRTGRFLDSIGDFVVDAVIFGSIGWILFQQNHDWTMVMAGFLGLAGITLRVSYHVFYQVHFLHLARRYETNRITEEVRNEDLVTGGYELTLQYIFQFIYGWQDRLMVLVDAWCAGWPGMESSASTDETGEPTEWTAAWYSDTIGLRISGFLGFGTELFLLMICSVMNRLELYLYLNIFLMNGILFAGIVYRRFVLSRVCARKNNI